jgi:hypothetical protein
MRQSIRVVDEVGKEVHQALTELLGLEDFNTVLSSTQPYYTISRPGST